MSDTDLSGGWRRPVRRPKKAPAGARSELLALAQRNTAALLAFLYLIEIFWLLASRLARSLVYAQSYQVSPLEWGPLVLFVALAIFFAWVARMGTFLVRPLPKCKVPYAALKVVIVLTVAMNLLMLMLVDQNARYTSGALTGLNGVIYGFSQALTMTSLLLVLRHKNSPTPVSLWLVLTLLASYALTIDGLAKALLLAVFLGLYFDVQIRRPLRLVAMGAAGVGLYWLGISAKFVDVPDYFTPPFIIRWVVSRFAIQAEHMYTYLSGESIVGARISHMDLVWRAITERFELIFKGDTFYQYPRSLSEALYFDAWGFYGAGSSPGIFLGTAVQGYLLFALVPIFLAFVLLQYFYGIKRKLPLTHLIAYSFLFKGVYTNVSEYMAIISPNVLYLLFFILGCIIAVQPPPLRRDPRRSLTA